LITSAPVVGDVEGVVDLIVTVVEDESLPIPMVSAAANASIVTTFCGKMLNDERLDVKSPPSKFKSPSKSAFPPILRFSPIATPPETINAPVEVEVDDVMSLTNCYSICKVPVCTGYF